MNQRQRLREVAVERYGYITARDASAMGVPHIELVKLAARGGLSRIGHGVYRFDDVPSTNRDEYMEAVLLAGPTAFLIDDAVLALHDLALVNPPRIRVGIQSRSRRSVPPTIEVVHRRVDPGDLTVYQGIPSTTIARAILDCHGRVERSRLASGVKEARAQGLISSRDATRVMREMRASA